MGQSKKPNYRPYSPRRSGPASLSDRIANLCAPKKRSKGQDSRKVHDTKGKNNHGRSSW
jgi:hypothetical protein